jgi:hypothetical protein
VPPIKLSTFPSPALPRVDSPDVGLHFKQHRIRGRSGSASWKITVPQFSGGSAAREANRRVGAAARDLIARVRREATHDAGAKRTLSGHATVVTNDGRTIQITIIFVDFLAGTAHPANSVTTTVVDVNAVRPVLLKQVIQNPPEGLRALRAQVVTTATKEGEVVDRVGLAPKLSNWANWQSTPRGLVFAFNDYQLGMYGLRFYTVPWRSAKPLLSAYGEHLLAPH